MNNLLVVDATLFYSKNAGQLSGRPLGGRGDSLDRCASRTAAVGRVDQTVVNCLPDDADLFKKKFSSAVVETASRPADLQALLSRLRDLGEKFQAENLTLVYADSPFLDPNVGSEVVKTHLENAAEYTFADNCPDGLAVEVMSRDFLKEIVRFQPKRPEILSRRVFDNLSADINQFYVEVWLPEEDMSLRRLEFHSNSKRNLALLENVVRRLPEPGLVSINKLLTDDPETLFIFPRYVECEITTEVNEKRILIPDAQFKRPVARMDPGLFNKLVAGLTAEFDDVILSFSGHGEPLLHPGFSGFLDHAAGSGLFSVLIETNGVLFSGKIAEKVSALPASRCQVIFKIDAAKPATYSGLKGAELAPVVANIESFLAMKEENKYKTFVQFTKLPENIEELEEFYRFWDSKGVQVIIMKYNDFAGQLPDRKVSDLTPLDRLPCWHLQRDLVVFADGSIPVCKQDFNGLKPVANIASTTVAEAWQKLKPYFAANSAGRFDLWPYCAKCDEWYTYNF